MTNISISDLYPSEIESLLDTEDKKGGLMKTSVNRALEVRGALGAVYKLDPITKLDPVIGTCPPITVGIIAQPNFSTDTFHA